MSSRLKKSLIGSASGIMIAASVWSLLLPAIEMTEAGGGAAWLPATVGFLAGTAFLLALDIVIPRICEGGSKERDRSLMLVLAVTLHNIPEGMAVGVAMAGMLDPEAVITPAEAIALSVGIAVQNFPEGAIVSAPLLTSGFTKSRSFIYGVLSGIVEPIAAVLTVLLTSLVTPVLPYILSFAAGAMIYVVVQELIPEGQEGGRSYIAAIGTAFGFALMMLLDVALG
ncbi:MAG: ZIP family metal transporter [Clostridia bacterium]|nr:ZIP family metal transporter [Clostridia bacterium]